MSNKVLVVDDDNLFSKGLARALRTRGCDVIEAQSAEEALRILDSTKFDYVISDVAMPGRSGLDLFIEARARGIRAPFTLMTGGPQPISGASMDGPPVLAKPLDVDALRADIGLHAARRAIDAWLEISFHPSFVMRPIHDAAGGLSDLGYMGMNADALRLLGRSRTEVVGRTVRDLLPGAASQLIAAAANVFATGASQELEFETNDQHTRWVRYRLALQGDLLLVVANDATSEHEEQRGLAAKAKRYAAIVQVQQELSTMGLDEDEVYDVTVRRAASLTGADGAFIAFVDSEEDLVYRTATGSMSPHVGMRLPRATSLSGRCVALRSVLVSDDAQSDPRADNAMAVRVAVRSAVCVPLVADGEAIGVLAVVASEARAFGEHEVHALQLLSGIMAATIERAREVERRRAAQRDLLAARDVAEAATLAKSRFLANMSHEIRTPLHGLLGNTEMLLGMSLTGEQQECAETMRDSASSLLVVLNDVLDLSKIEAGKLDIVQGEVVIRSMMKQVTTLFRPASVEKHLELSMAVDDSVPQAVSGDGARIRQVLSNLVGNAVKFTPSGTVRVGATVVPGTGARDSLRFFIADTGPGLSAEDAERLFVPFQQGDSSTTRIHGGTGLGLAISRSLLDLMDGQMGVDRNDDGGSTFWFTLPIRAPVHQLVEAAAPDRALPAGLRVLVAEDNRVNQRIVRRMLEQLGCEVDIVDDGFGAVDAMSARDYDLVFMDCQMPELDGYEATRAIRGKEKDAKRTPIIALTASALHDDRARCLDAGMDGHVAKPFTRDDLATILSKRAELRAAP